MPYGPSSVLGWVFCCDQGTQWGAVFSAALGEGAYTGAASGLYLEGRVCSMLTVRLGGDVDGLSLGSESQTQRCAQLSDRDSDIAPLWIRENA